MVSKPLLERKIRLSVRMNVAVPFMLKVRRSSSLRYPLLMASTGFTRLKSVKKSGSKGVVGSSLVLVSEGVLKGKHCTVLRRREVTSEPGFAVQWGVPSVDVQPRPVVGLGVEVEINQLALVTRLDLDAVFLVADQAQRVRGGLRTAAHRCVVRLLEIIAAKYLVLPVLEGCVAQLV